MGKKQPSLLLGVSFMSLSIISSNYAVAVGTSSNDVSVPFLATFDPSSTNVGYPLGKRWINKSGNSEFVLTSYTPSNGTLSANWQTSASPTGSISTITGDSGGALSPSAGNINILGTAAQITTTGSGSTLTISIPTTFSIGSTAGAAGGTISVGTGDFVLAGAAASDITLGSGISTGNILFGADQTSGTLTIGGSAQSGTIAIRGGAGGTVEIANTSGTTTLNLALGGGINNVNLATGLGNNIIAIGSTAGTSSIAMGVGTGNFSLNGVAGSTYSIGASTTTGTILIGGTAQTGAITLGSSSGTNIVNLGTGAGATTINIATGVTNAKTIHIGDGAISGNVITIGSTTGTGAITLNAGLGPVTSNSNFICSGSIQGITLYASADAGGVAANNSLSNVNSTTIGAGDGTIKMSSGNPGTNTGWMKCYIGTQVAWIPTWTTNSP